MTRLEIKELKRLSVPVEVAWLEALDARGPVLGLRCSDPLVDAEVHHGHGVLGDSGGPRHPRARPKTAYSSQTSPAEHD